MPLAVLHGVWTGYSRPQRPSALQSAWSRAKAQVLGAATGSAPGNLIDFTTATYPRYDAEPAHRLIAERLRSVVAGEIDRLMIFAPPQHGKSELASVRLPAFWLGHHPDLPVAIASYAATLAQSKSRQVRDTLESQEYAGLFPGVTTRRDSRAVDYWRLAAPHRGGVWAGGVGGPITGHGFGLGIIDDPFENWAQAQSQTMRDRVWEWWRGTFRTRIWEGGRVVLIMTRWHEDDLAGRLLQTQGQRWSVLRLPAVAETPQERAQANGILNIPLADADPLNREPGQPLCPRRFSLDALTEIREDVGEMVWFAEYQGTPRAPEGVLFKREWFRIIDAAPAGVRWCRFWDLATSAKETGDFTAGPKVGVDDSGNLYIADMVHGRWEWPDARRIITQTAQMDGPGVMVGVEQVAFQLAAIQELWRDPALIGHVIHASRPDKDKIARAQPWVARAERGRVYLVRGAWNGAFLNEATSFPVGAHDDQVDAVSGALSLLAQRQPATVTTVPSILTDYTGI